MAMQRKTWTISALSVELRTDRRTLAKILEDVAPAEEKKTGTRIEKRWLMADVVARLLDQRIAELIGDAEGEPLNLEQQRARLAKAQADRQELALRRERCEVLPLDLVASFWQGLVAAARAKLLSMPTRLAPRVVAAKTLPEAEAEIKSQVYEALSELAGDGLPPEVLDQVREYERTLAAGG